MSKKKQIKEVEPDFSPTPFQNLIWETKHCNYDPKKVKKAFIKVFGTEKIRIGGDINLDDFIEIWCQAQYEYDLFPKSKVIGNRIDFLASLIIDHLSEFYTEGQKKVWFREVKN